MVENCKPAKALHALWQLKNKNLRTQRGHNHRRAGEKAGKEVFLFDQLWGKKTGALFGAKGL